MESLAGIYDLGSNVRAEFGGRRSLGRGERVFLREGGMMGMGRRRVDGGGEGKGRVWGGGRTGCFV